jgi:hypothetical protein
MSAVVPLLSARRIRARRVSALLAAIALLATPASSQAADIGPTIYDIVLVRPLAFAHTFIGALVFIPAAIQAAPGGTIGEAYNTFILAPANDLVNRPLGEF